MLDTGEYRVIYLLKKSRPSDHISANPAGISVVVVSKCRLEKMWNQRTQQSMLNIGDHVYDDNGRRAKVIAAKSRSLPWKNLMQGLEAYERPTSAEEVLASSYILDRWRWPSACIDRYKERKMLHHLIN
jgi:hypothetical protein